jgi:hypothetical protein
VPLCTRSYVSEEDEIEELLNQCLEQCQLESQIEISRSNKKISNNQQENDEYLLERFRKLSEGLVPEVTQPPTGGSVDSVDSVIAKIHKEQKLETNSMNGQKNPTKRKTRIKKLK